MGVEARKRAFFVGRHEAAVANYVAREHRGKAALDALFGHRERPWFSVAG